MKKVLFSLAVSLAFLQGIATAAAPVAEKECATECAACPVSKAMEALPKLTYNVGGEELCCPNAAAKLAEEKNGHIHFVVAGKEFHEKGKAMLALADVTEKFVKDFATPHKCDVSGKTTVCGNSMSCEVSAGALAKKAHEAMKTVSLAYQVGDEKCNCPNAAAALAKESGKEKHFVIGKETTCCEVDARIKLAQARYAAAVKAIQPQQEAKAEAAPAVKS